MLSELKARIRTVSLGDALEVLSLAEILQGETKRLYDVIFVHCATSAILAALNDLSTSAVMLEVEVSETRKFYRNFTEIDVSNRFFWISQDIRRIEGSLKLLENQLWLSNEPEANILKAQIERLLE